MNKILIMLCVLMLATTTMNTSGAVIGPDDFRGNETIETFSDLGYLPDHRYASFDINGTLYEATNGKGLRYTGGHGHGICFSGTCLGTNTGGSTVVAINLGQSVNRVGIYLGGGGTNNGNQFLLIYDLNGNLIESTGAGLRVDPDRQVYFYGLESINVPIFSISLMLGGGGVHSMTFDNLTIEQAPTVPIPAVPIPATAWLFGSALLGLGAMKRKKAA
jgi:hypothetical protein